MKKILCLALLALAACDDPAPPAPQPPTEQPNPPRDRGDECPRTDKFPCK